MRLACCIADARPPGRRPPRSRMELAALLEQARLVHEVVLRKQGLDLLPVPLDSKIAFAHCCQGGGLNSPSRLRRREQLEHRFASGLVRQAPQSIEGCN